MRPRRHPASPPRRSSRSSRRGQIRMCRNPGVPNSMTGPKTGGRVSGSLSPKTSTSRHLTTVARSDILTPDATAIRDYVHIIDLADAHARALNFLQEPGQSEFLNLGTGHGYSVMQVIQTAREITGREIRSCVKPARPEIRRDWPRTTRGQRNWLAGRRHPIFARS